MTRTLTPRFSPSSVALCLLALLVLGYCCVRAVYVPFTHDESYSYLHWAQQPLLAIVTYEHGALANNHLVNTLAMKVMGMLSDAPLALRTPVLIACAFWLWGAARVSRLLAGDGLAPFAFALLVCNPFVLDYFAVARGYGFAMAFLVWAIDSALRFIDDDMRQSRALKLALLTVGAVVSCFPFLIAAASLLAALCLALACRIRRRELDRRQVAAALLPSIFVFAASALVSAPILLRLATQGEFHFGSDAGFWKGTVGSIVRNSYYDPSSSDMSGVGIVLAAVGLALAVAAFALHARRPEHGGRATRVLLLALLPLIAGLASTLQSVLLGTPYLYERTAIFFLPMFTLLLIASLASLPSRFAAIAGKALLGASAVLLVIHLGRRAQWESMICGLWEADVPAMLQALDKERDGKNGVRLGIDWSYEPSINYYRQRLGHDWLLPVTRDGMRGQAYDFYYHGSTLSQPKRPSRPTVEIRRFAVSDTLLLRAKSP